MVKVLDGGIVLSEFEFQSRYYVHFQIIARLKFELAFPWILMFTFRLISMGKV